MRHSLVKFGSFLFLYVSNELTTTHCSTGFGKVKSPMFSAAVQNRLKSRHVPLHL